MADSPKWQLQGDWFDVGPGGVATWGTATTDRADAFGFKWSRGGQSSKHIPFSWSGPG